jgi:hypothetical protein
MLPAQAARIAWKMRRRAGGLRPALVYGALTLFSKWLHMLGQLFYLRDRLAGRHARLIEYKDRSAAPEFGGRATAAGSQGVNG